MLRQSLEMVVLIKNSSSKILNRLPSKPKVPRCFTITISMREKDMGMEL